MLPRELPAEVGYVNVSRFDQTSLQIPITGGFYYGPQAPGRQGRSRSGPWR